MAQTVGGKETNANEPVDGSPIKEVTVTKDGTKTYLDVLANLIVKDIQIGAVELKDATTDTRQKVKSDGVDNAAVITANVLPLPTGAATSAKQLANDHDVNVSNMIPAVETGLATSANQQTDALTDTELRATPVPISGSVTATVDISDLATADKQDDIITAVDKLIGFEIPAYDYLAISYVATGNGAGEIETVVYKTGGSGGTIVATLTLSYNSDNELSGVTKT